MKQLVLTAKLLKEVDPTYDTLLELYENDKTDLVEDLLELIEKDFDEELSANVFDKLSDLERYYSDCWDEWIIPEIRDRLQKNKSVNPKNIIVGLHACPPKKNGQDVSDILAGRLNGILDLKYSNCNDELFQWMEEYCGIPPEWEEEMNINHFTDELKDFNDPKAIEEMMDAGIDYDEIKMEDILTELAQNGKANNHLELFLRLIDASSPASNCFRSYDKEYKANIINEGTWDEKEFNKITEEFYDVDFEMPYSDIIKESVQAECDHITKMTAINPLYRHD